MPAKKKENKETLSFEASITKLEEIANTLENQSPELEKALALYEEGARLLKECTKMLTDAQAKITVISKD